MERENRSFDVRFRLENGYLCRSCPASLMYQSKPNTRHNAADYFNNGTEWPRGWWLGVGFLLACTMQLAKYTNRKNGREKKKKSRKERGESESCCQPFEGHKPHLVTPYEEYSNRNPFDRERRLLPNPSIGFNGHRYSNLYSTEGSRSSHPSSQPVEDTFRALSATNNRRRVAIGVDKRKTKEWKGICILFSFFFFLLFCVCVYVCDIVSSSILAKLERKRHWQMHGNLRSAFSPPLKDFTVYSLRYVPLDLEKSFFDGQSPGEKLRDKELEWFNVSMFRFAS